MIHVSWSRFTTLAGAQYALAGVLILPVLPCSLAVQAAVRVLNGRTLYCAGVVVCAVVAGASRLVSIVF